MSEDVSDKFGGFRLPKGDSLTAIVERMPNPISRSLLMEQAEEHVRQARDRLGRNPTTRAVAMEAYFTGYFMATMLARQSRSAPPKIIVPGDGE